MAAEPSYFPESPRPSWRARALLLFGLGGTALVAGLLLRNSDAILLATPLLLAPGSVFLLAPRSLTRIVVRGELSEVEEDLEIAMTFEATPPLPGGWLEVEIEPPEGVIAIDGVLRRVVVGQDPQLRTSFRLRPFRPLFVRLTTPKIRWRDPLGLSEVLLPTRGEGLSLERYPPEVRRIPRLAIQRTTPLPGELRSRRRASQGDFVSVRNYAAGDTPRQINWWASARRGELSSNEYHAERSGEMIICVDARPSGLPGGDDRHLLGVARSAALGLARYLLKEKTRVGLVIFGEFVKILPLGGGRVQRYAIEQTLQDARLSEVAGPVERLSISLQRHFPIGTPVLLLTPMIDDETVGAGYFLRRNGFPCMLLCPSPSTLESERMDHQAEDADITLRLVRLLRRRRLSEAWQSSPVVEWEDFSSLASLVAFLRRPPASMIRGGAA
ncbi:MAG: DUF58 domain-containing protein [Euryarchaeota archaeon]|nr:DUF58 domain-containing protein [Euryarchaeota archaeon]MDE1837274.1 DUF58 domain-containing protein [Euryarchaeota archaeon]MDE2045122.1 DUF58 domain-containing protein [Thermoplasmata archaeon]